MGTLGTVLAVVGGIGSLIFGIQILILAFKKSVGWGIGSLLLFVPIGLIFVFQNWAACKTPFLRWVASFVVAMIGYALMAAGMFSTAMSAPAVQ